MSSWERASYLYYTVSMYLRASVIVALMLFPAVSNAAEAVFPSQSLWLSDTKPSQGEKVRIYAVVYNAGDADLSGALTFLVDTKTQEVRDLTLKSGESTVVSTLWTASEGEHTFSARFAGKGTADSEAVISASVVAKVDAPPSAVEQTITQAKDVGSQIASTSLPILSSVANTVFDATESMRNAGIDYLESKTAAASASTNPAQEHDPEVLGTSTVRAIAEGGGKSSSGGLFAKISQTAAAGALAVFKSLWLFYPILVLLLLLIFRWLYKWVTRPRF